VEVEFVQHVNKSGLRAKPKLINKDINVQIAEVKVH